MRMALVVSIAITALLQDVAAARPRVVVVPFSSSGGASRSLAQRATQRLMVKLTRQGTRPRLLRVAQTAGLRRCLQAPACVRRLARRQGASYVVTGYVTWVEGRYHVDLHLLSAQSGQISASDAFEIERPQVVQTRGANAAAALVRRELRRSVPVRVSVNVSLTGAPDRLAVRRGRVRVPRSRPAPTYTEGAGAAEDEGIVIREHGSETPGAPEGADPAPSARETQVESNADDMTFAAADPGPSEPAAEEDEADGIVIRDHQQAAQAQPLVDARSQALLAAVERASASAGYDTLAAADSEAPDGLTAEHLPGSAERDDAAVAPAAHVPAPSRSARPGLLSRLWDRRYLPAWLAAGGSVALVTAGAVLGGLVVAENASAREAETQPQAEEHRSSASTLALTANVLFGLSGAAAIAAGLLYYFEQRREPIEHAQRSEPRRVGVALGARGAGLELRGEF